MDSNEDIYKKVMQKARQYVSEQCSPENVKDFEKPLAAFISKHCRAEKLYASDSGCTAMARQVIDEYLSHRRSDVGSHGNNFGKAVDPNDTLTNIKNTLSEIKW